MDGNPSDTCGSAIVASARSCACFAHGFATGMCEFVALWSSSVVDSLAIETPTATSTTVPSLTVSHSNPIAFTPRPPLIPLESLGARDSLMIAERKVPADENKENEGGGVTTKKKKKKHTQRQNERRKTIRRHLQQVGLSQRGTNAYIMYREDRRQEMNLFFGSLTLSDMARLSGNLWTRESNQVRLWYKNAAKREAARLANKGSVDNGSLESVIEAKGGSVRDIANCTD